MEIEEKFLALKMDYARLHGELIGTLEAFLLYDIPEEVRVRIRTRLVELISRETTLADELIDYDPAV